MKNKLSISFTVQQAINKGWIKKPAVSVEPSLKLKKGQTRKALLLSRLTPTERHQRYLAQKRKSQNKISAHNKAQGLTWEGKPYKQQTKLTQEERTVRKRQRWIRYVKSMHSQGLTSKGTPFKKKVK